MVFGSLRSVGKHEVLSDNNKRLYTFLSPIVVDLQATVFEIICQIGRIDLNNLAYTLRRCVLTGERSKSKCVNHVLAQSVNHVALDTIQSFLLDP